MKTVTLENWNFFLDVIEEEIINKDMSDKEKIEELWRALNNMKTMFYPLSKWREYFRKTGI